MTPFRRTSAAAALLLLALPARAAGAPDHVAASTAAPAAIAPPAAENPWSMTYGIDRRGRRFGRLDYRLRWSLSDLNPARPADERPDRRGLAAERTWRGLLQGSGFEVYGVRVRPFRDLPLAPTAEFAAPLSTGTAAAPSRPGRPPLYSWGRFYEDLEDSARRETERFLVREGFDRALPGQKSAPYEQKKALGEGLLELGREAVPDAKAR